MLKLVSKDDSGETLPLLGGRRERQAKVRFTDEAVYLCQQSKRVGERLVPLEETDISDFMPPDFPGPVKDFMSDRVASSAAKIGSDLTWPVDALDLKRRAMDECGATEDQIADNSLLVALAVLAERAKPDRPQLIAAQLGQLIAWTITQTALAVAQRTPHSELIAYLHSPHQIPMFREVALLALSPDEAA